VLNWLERKKFGDAKIGMILWKRQDLECKIIKVSSRLNNLGNRKIEAQLSDCLAFSIITSLCYESERTIHALFHHC